MSAEKLVKTISTFGLTESAIAERLTGFEETFTDIQLGLRAKFPEIQIKLCTSGLDQEDLNIRMTEASIWVVKQIGAHVFSYNGEPMENVIGSLLREKNHRLTVAESCTGGLISHLLTEVPGSSDYFLFSGVTYSNQAKEKVLGVSADTLKKYGAVHEQTAKEMAAGARKLCGATFGLSTSGIAGPDGGTQEKPVGTVCIGLATSQAAEGHRLTFSNVNRQMNKKRFAMAAMDILRRHLIGIQ